MPLDPEDDMWPITARKMTYSVPSRRLSPRMAKMLDYIDRCGGTIIVTHLVLMPPVAHRTINALMKRAYVRQNNTFDIFALPRDLDQRRAMVGLELTIPDLDNL